MSPYRRNLSILSLPSFRKELQVNDRDGRLVFYTNGTLSQEKRDELEHALNAWSEAVRQTISGAALLHQDSSQSSKNNFSAFHFSYYSKYGVKVSNTYHLPVFSVDCCSRVMTLPQRSILYISEEMAVSKPTHRSFLLILPLMRYNSGKLTIFFTTRWEMWFL